MPHITLIAHNIRSTHNVGSIFRTAEGFGVHHIILSGYTPYPKMVNDPRLPHIADKIDAQIHKTALGAETMIPFSHYEHIDDALSGLGMPIIALEQAPNSIPLSNCNPPETFALLLGEEVHGVERELLARCHTILEIPMVGQKESFNVSVATGITLYELTRST